MLKTTKRDGTGLVVSNICFGTGGLTNGADADTPEGCGGRMRRCARSSMAPRISSTRRASMAAAAASSGSAR